MKEEVYKYSLKRGIWLWLFPLFVFGFVLIVFTNSIRYVNLYSIEDYFAWGLFFIFCFGIFVFLFYNHLYLARNTELVLNKKSGKIIQFEQTCNFSYDEINSIVEYSTNRLPWSSIIKWKIILNDKEFTISSLTISDGDMEYYFYKKIDWKPHSLPLIKKKEIINSKNT